MIYSENILICIALPLIAMLPFIYRKARRYFIALILGMTMCLFAAYLNGFFEVVYGMEGSETAKHIAPFVEEIMKMFPIVMFVGISRPDSKEIIAYSVSVGAGFATFENCCYITAHGADMVSFILIRGLAVGVMHILCGIIIGIGIIMALKYKAAMIPGMFGSFSFAMTIHALYNLLVSDTGVYQYIGFAVPLIGVGIIYTIKDRIYAWK